MSDRHVRILRVMARHRQRRLDEHDATPTPDPDAGSAARRDDLQRTAAVTRARVVAAEVRKRRPSEAL
ncbi:MAG: hypothetical protein QOC78_2884 [Solirubrobacteraceae bacterium]|nr:hypothetical protein [Solirubrobacteraceae bacterium]MEA2277924.1 hypothetical protein [Solirubrobacteraceae bacterium]MEA2396109.1 hypothetical protein [Solirubrobacteraceae bacterium]